MNPLTQSKNTTILPILIGLTLACFGLSPQARAICQEGCLTNDNTVLEDDAFLNNTSINNTAIGASALYNNTTGSSNTAVGAHALSENDTGVARLSSASISLRTSAPLRTQRHLNTPGNGHPTLFRVPKN